MAAAIPESAVKAGSAVQIQGHVPTPVVPNPVEVGSIAAVASQTPHPVEDLVAVSVAVSTAVCTSSLPLPGKIRSVVFSSRVSQPTLFVNQYDENC